MRWASASAHGPDAKDLVARVAAEVVAGLLGSPPHVALAFLGPRHILAAADILQGVRRALGPVPVVGCSAGGVIGGGREHEQPAALSLTAGSLPGVAVSPFHVEDDELPDADAPPAAWHRPLGVPASPPPIFVLLADPFTIRAEALLEGLDFSFPASVKVGGLASGASRPGAQALFSGDRVVASGAVGVALTGDVALTPAVAQGCRGFGPVLTVTACEGTLLQGLDGAPALDGVRRVLAEASERDRSLARSTALFLGVKTDPFSADAGDGAWLIRNVLGVDPEAGSLHVGEVLRPGRRVRFHVRDRVTSAEDLDRTLSKAQGAGGAPASGALLFSCMGRGMHLYGVPDHDTRAFQAHFSGVPLGGFFCSGEIGPVGGETRLHGYTSSFGIFRSAKV